LGCSKPYMSTHLRRSSHDPINYDNRDQPSRDPVPRSCCRSSSRCVLVLLETSIHPRYTQRSRNLIISDITRPSNNIVTPIPPSTLHPYSSSSRCNVPDGSPPTSRDRLDAKGWDRPSEEGEGVSKGDVDCFGVDVASECDGTVIGKSGGLEDALDVSWVALGRAIPAVRRCCGLSSLRTRAKSTLVCSRDSIKIRKSIS
jgi:hypothetical protein